MEKVAEHINEMQRIHEEYGAIFDHLFRQHQKSCKQPIDLSPGKCIFVLIIVQMTIVHIYVEMLINAQFISWQVIFCITVVLNG